MKVLWIANTIFPAPSKALGFPLPVVGGWMYGLAEELSASPNVRLAVATTYSGKKVKTFEIEGVLYYLLPAKSKLAYQKHLDPIWQQISEEFEPDVVHIHGTEFPHGLACMRSCPKLNYVVSIQGLVSVYSRYYLANMSTKDILTHITFRDVVRRDTIFQGRKNFVKRGAFEKEYLQRTKHIIGRTRWDYAHAKNINPSVNYHFCNESLRDEFYTSGKWDIACKKNYSIFLSQAGYPIKGAHQVFKAATMLKKDFPDINIRIAGHSLINNTTFSEKLRLSGYGSYLRSLIKKGGLQDNVEFLGPLQAQQMIDEYRNAHLFICPSSIENSPNSLGEAQILGTPAIAAYVGGIPDMVIHNETGLLYRFEEIEMLAENIRAVFADDVLAKKLSSAGIVAAERRHDRQTILTQTMNSYSKVSI